MLRLGLCGVVLLCFVAGPTLVAADESVDARLRSGAILGVNFVYVISDFDFESSAFDSDDPLGVEVSAGYRFNRYVSLEGILQYLSEFDIDANAGFPATFTAWGLSFMPATKVYPLADVLPPWVQPFGQFGIGVLFAHSDGFGSDNDATAGFRFGGGVDFYLAPQIVALAVVTFSRLRT
jgi:hypothetical protein